MTEQEILAIVTTFISSHWEEIAGSLFTGAITLIASTWYLSKAWYGREISHLKAQIESLNQLHNERAYVLKDKAEERTNYAKGIVEIAEQRVLAIEHDNSKLLEQILQYKSELNIADSIIAKSETLEHERKDKAIVAHNKEEAIEEIKMLLSFHMFHDSDTGELSPIISKFVKQISKETESLSLLSLFVPVIGTLVSMTLHSRIKADKSTEVLSKFHLSYYRSIKNILEPIKDEASSINSIDAKKIIDREIHHLESDKKVDE